MDKSAQICEHGPIVTECAWCHHVWPELPEGQCQPRDDEKCKCGDREWRPPVFRSVVKRVNVNG